MSLASVIFLAFMFAVIAVTVFKLRSEKFEKGPGALDVGAEFPVSGDFSGASSQDSSHHLGCDAGGSHDAGTSDCGHGGFDGGGHH